MCEHVDNIHELSRASRDRHDNNVEIRSIFLSPSRDRTMRSCDISLNQQLFCLTIFEQNASAIFRTVSHAPFVLEEARATRGGMLRWLFIVSHFTWPLLWLLLKVGVIGLKSDRYSAWLIAFTLMNGRGKITHTQWVTQKIIAKMNGCRWYWNI